MAEGCQTRKAVTRETGATGETGETRETGETGEESETREMKDKGRGREMSTKTSGVKWEGEGRRGAWSELLLNGPV